MQDLEGLSASPIIKQESATASHELSLSHVAAQSKKTGVQESTSTLGQRIAILKEIIGNPVKSILQVTFWLTKP